MKFIYPILVSAALFPAAQASAQSSAFTYQGRLSDSGVAANGLYEMLFTLRDAATNGTAVASPIGQAVGVTNGLFTTSLNFGSAPFDGSARWLEISVRTNGSVLPLSLLAPAQLIGSTPYAHRASTVTSFTGQVSDAQISTNMARLNASPSFNSTVTLSPSAGAPFIVNSTNRVNNLNVDLLDGLNSTAFWNVLGNSATSLTNFIGTTDNQPLQFRVNNSRALRLEAGGGAPNLIGGHSNNLVAVGIGGATISGGGTNNFTNRVTASYGTIGGGLGNSVFGGESFIGGGNSNTIQTNSEWASIAGGRENVAYLNADFAVIGGGDRNWIGTNGTSSVISGGASNTIVGTSAVISGGLSNIVRGAAATVGGGERNAATNIYSTVPGGFLNSAGGQFSFAAGQRARALHNGSFVWADASTSSFLDSTADNQFIIRAVGGLGIGAAPVDSVLDVEGSTRINDFDLYFRTGSDRNHGLGWYGNTKLFGGQSVDGPVLYGFSGGALGTSSGTQLSLQWNSSGNVGIGKAPGVRLDVLGTAQTVGRFESSHTGGTWLNLNNTSTGGGSWDLIATGSGNGEGAGHLLFFGNGATRATILNNGFFGIGTISPGERLELFGQDTTLRIRNSNDGGGGFIGNTFGALQLGLYNPSASAFGVIPAGTKRSFFGFDNQGRVGSLLNNYGNPSFRNMLDDGSGNMSVTTSGSLSFGSATRQMLNLWGTTYGIGVQNNTLYQRSDANFAWYRLGTHSNTTYDPGAGGSTLMRLDSGGLTVNGTFISSSDRQRKQNFSDVKSRDVLDRLATLAIQKWSYKDDAKVQHIGPMAQDFNAAFGVGPDDKHITMVDADGVSFAAIQGLHEIVNDQATEIKRLQNTVDDLKKIVEKLASDRK